MGGLIRAAGLGEVEAVAAFQRGLVMDEKQSAVGVEHERARRVGKGE
jgi:hypothetical protein